MKLKMEEMTKGLLALILVLGFTNSILADIRQSHQCERNGIQRTVELVSAKGAVVPCQVVYSKPMEDQSSTSLWYAQNDASYCQVRYDSFIVKLESKLNWSCTPIDHLQAIKPVPIQTNAKPPADDPVAPVVTTTESSTPQINKLADSSNNAPPITGPGIPDTSDDEDNKVTPNLSAALPSSEFGKPANREISLPLIRQLFPAGHYTTSTDIPHTGNTSICPAAGFFIWNTKRSDKPAFETRQNTVFTFNLGQFTDQSETAFGGGVRSAQCDYGIQSSYCIDNQLQGQTTVSDDIARSLSCRPQNAVGSTVRQLTMISTLSEPTAPGCAADMPADAIGLSSLPMTSSSNDVFGGVGFEIAIIEDEYSNANCRYVRGH